MLVTLEGRREAHQRQQARRRHPVSRPVRRAELAPPPVAFYALALTFGALVMLGLIMVLSASSITSFHADQSPWRYFTKQLMWAGLGVIALTVMYKVPYLTWRRLSKPILAIGVLAMLAPFVPGLGRSVNGARAWISVGGQSIQPSEFMKLAILIFCADLLSTRRGQLDDLRATFKPCIYALLLVAGLTVLQADLGSAVVITMIVLVVMFIGGVPVTPLAATGAAFAVAGVGFVSSSAYRRARWTAFLDIKGNKGHSSYQVWQAMISIANGGPSGVGVGAGTGKWGYVPLAHSDFIFAIVAEELGLVGAVAVIGGFALITFFGVQVALAAADRFGMMVAGGIATWFAVQAVINIGGVTGVMPVTGLTLPFISFGGSSLMASMAAAGLLLNIARHARS
jgi:cell division protein FtsW